MTVTPRRLLGPVPHADGGSVVVVGGLVGFVVGVYVVVVLGGGTLIGQTDSPSLPLSVLATTVVALLFARVQAALHRATIRLGLTATAPYDVLSRFSDAITDDYAADKVPAHMAMLLAQATGATWVQVWLSVSGRMTLAATWPTDVAADQRCPSVRPEDDVVTGSRALPVHEGAQLLGVIRLQERPGSTLTLVEERLFAGLAAQAGLVLRWVGLRAELDDRRAELLVRAEEIKASRQRLITAQDAERSRLERDLHDGAQQHLVALTVNLRLASTIVDRSPLRAAAVLCEQAAAASEAIKTLWALSRGIYPRQLTDEGLGAALRSAVAASALPVTVDTRGLPRLPAAIEAAIYFCGMEAVQNAAKHSGAGSVFVKVAADSCDVRLTVTDNGSGFDQLHTAAASGTGMANMRDRIDAVGGIVQVTSPERIGTTVIAVIPSLARL